MNEEIEKTYEPKKAEEKWYSFWLKNGLFSSKPEAGRKPFTIVIPPPNITGSLHMGHALNNTLQDIIIRFKKSHLIVHGQQPILFTLMCLLKITDSLIIG